MSEVVRLELQGLPEVRQMLDQLGPREMYNRTRRALRAGAAVMRAEMRREGAAPGYPSGFRKTRTRNHRWPLGVSVSPKSPLSNIFEHGARAHPIAPKKARVLAGRAGERWRTRPFFARGPVTHPGMAARPFIAPVFQAAEPGAEQAFRAKFLEGL
jgi:hypothetical protein